MNNNKSNKDLILIADRGRADVATRLAFLSQKLEDKFNLDTIILFEGKQKKLLSKIFDLFKLHKRLKVQVRFDKPFLILQTIFYGVFLITKINFFGFDWFVKDASVKNIKIGDLIYDRYIRKGHHFIKPKFLNIKFIKLLFISIFKLLYLERFFKKNSIRYSLIGSITYLSISSLLLRISQKNKVPVIYLSHDNYSIIKGNYEIGDILKRYLLKEIKSLNQKKLLIKSEKYFKNRVRGKLEKNKFNKKNYYEHDELTWTVNREKNLFLKKVNKIKKNFKSVILLAPHNFAESNHRCGDLIFRDFYQQTIETLKFAKKNKDILWLFKIHPYSKSKYEELTIAKNLFEKFKCDNILLVPPKTSNEGLFDLVNLVASSRGTICLEAAAFGVNNLINCDIFYDTDNISIRAKTKQQYYMRLSKSHLLKKINNKSKIKAKKILYFRKKLQKERPYNLITKILLISDQVFYSELKKNYKKFYKSSKLKNKLYENIIKEL